MLTLPLNHCILPQPCRCCTFFRNDTIPFEQRDVAEAIEIGKRRQSWHLQHHRNSQRLNDANPTAENIIGAYGELAFEIFSGRRLLVDRSGKPGGDGGIDFRCGLLTIDIKTVSGKDHRLIHRVSSPVRADIYVLAWHNKANNSVVFQGATTGDVVRSAPQKIINGTLNAMNYTLEQTQLERGVDWLIDRIRRNLYD